ncbi:exosortase A [Pseudoduganella umbonata]|uniref:Exosortase A n=1 Tax=Pseudoduganella umbonata TaxID=864828 RepID=A0A4P8HWD5_9BURK|nr:exosortase A [Pseudoduganella umbonata]MBB3223808.1 exosortase A [Pseudoduganella umbonata]QCP12774.1 exosortase A [Pseudoduganella umbonata]
MNTITVTEEARLATARPVKDAPPTAQWWIAGLAVLLPLLAYLDTAASIVSIWERSETFAHGFVIVPITLWLVWRRRAQLALLPVRPCWPALAALLLCGAGWLLAVLGEVLVVRQYAFALMIPLAVLAVYGKAIARALTFPLAFLLFGVPVGEGLIEPLIGITANFTVDALRLTGIPVLREGNNFSIPSGNWSVVEACSGLRYLISSVTLGCLYAYLTYQSTWRRLLFVVVALALPVLANGLRAYMIVMIGHSSNMTLAVGVDHLIYGWAFFGLVMLLLFWLGSFWREDAAAVAVSAETMQRLPSVSPGRVGVAVLAVAACIGVWPAYGWYIERGNAMPPAVALASFAAKAPAVPAFTDWEPDFAPASANLRRFYQIGNQPVGFVLKYYRDGNGGKLISSTNRLTAQRSGWHETGVGIGAETIAGRSFVMRETTLMGPGGRVVVWQWYDIGGRPTTSNYVGKLLQTKQKFLTGSDDGAVLMLFSPYDEDPASARPALRAFLQTHLASIDAVLAANARQ